MPVGYRGFDTSGTVPRWAAGRTPGEEETMPKYVIERELPGAGKLSDDELREISQQSNKVIAGLGPEIRWQQSYVTDDMIYCVYIASDEDIVYEHARCGG